MNLTIASGKGGTGKTMLAVNLAYALSGGSRPVQLLDCDVECPNAHLYVHPNVQESHSVTVLRPMWNKDLCRHCGRCVEACNYNALALVKSQVLIFPELCHACGVCKAVCPVEAMQEQPYAIGTVETGEPEASFSFARGVLNIGEALAPAVIHAVKKHSKDEECINIVDSPPGTSCPSVAALEGADVAVLVTEPTPFGVHDLKLAMDLTRKMNIPSGIVINRSMGDDALVLEAAKEYGFPVIGKIPFSRDYAMSCSRGEILVNEFPALRQEFLSIYTLALELRGMPMPERVIEPIQSFVSGADIAVPKHDVACQELVVLSGKGGTGKTTVTAALTYLIPDLVIADLDVDAADMHLLLHPGLLSKTAFSGGDKAVIDSAACVGCGVCRDACRFEAIEMDHGVARIGAHLCEGCGLCAHLCSAGAISLTEHMNGDLLLSQTERGVMSHARLGVAEENSGKLVSRVREVAEEQAERQCAHVILDDGPPGSGCPVIASLSNVDRVLLVTEPSVSGIHDYHRLRTLLKHFDIPYGMVVNKSDLHPAGSAQMVDQARLDGCFLVETLPYDQEAYHALMAGQTMVQWGKGPALEGIKKIAEGVQRELNI